MEDSIYKSVEITGSSTASIDEAINGAVSRAGRTLRNIEWFEVTSIRGHVENDSVAHFQVTVKLGFRLD